MSAPLGRELQAHLTEIQNRSSIFHVGLRDSVTDALKYLAQQPPDWKLDYQIVLTPFFLAVQSDSHLFAEPVLLSFQAVFLKSPKSNPPSGKYIAQIFTQLRSLRFVSQEAAILCCNVCRDLIQSASSSIFMHGGIIRKIFHFMVRAVLSFESQAYISKAELCIEESIQSILLRSNSIQFPQFNDLKELTKFFVSFITNSSLEAVAYLSPLLSAGDFSPLAADVDNFIMLHSFSSMLSTAASGVCVSMLEFALTRQSHFFSTSTFSYFLHSLTILQSTSDFSRLLICIWRKFPSLFCDQMYQIFVKGVIPSLSACSKPSLLLESLSDYPQLFVDLFVNFDCDESRLNIFETTFSFVKSPSTISRVLSSLWSYFACFELSSSFSRSPHPFLSAKQTKSIFLKGVALFKHSFKDGIKFFISNGFVSSLPSFLFNTPLLDPAQVGLFLGDPSSKEVLKSYVNLFDFSSLSFEESLRRFLSKFQIPGEAQMIDRVMEAFGTKYFNDHPTEFKSSDTAYILSFSALMLHTDAHHPNVKNRMSLEEFIENNRKIDGGKDLPRQYLTELYRGITRRQILITRPQKFKEFQRSESPLFVSAMFGTIWRKAVDTLIESYQDDKASSISGLISCVHIASHCSLDAALGEIINEFSNLAMKDEKVKEELLEVVIEDRNFLIGSWRFLTKIISDDCVLNNQLFELSFDRESIVYFVSCVCAEKSLLIHRASSIVRSNIKLFWSIWPQIGESLAECGNEQAAYALWQLIMSYLSQRGNEGSEALLEPFETIYNQGQKEIALRHLESIAISVGEELKSAWGVIIRILDESAPNGLGLLRQTVKWNYNQEVSEIIVKFIERGSEDVVEQSTELLAQINDNKEALRGVMKASGKENVEEVTMKILRKAADEGKEIEESIFGKRFSNELKFLRDLHSEIERKKVYYSKYTESIIRSMTDIIIDSEKQTAADAFSILKMFECSDQMLLKLADNYVKVQGKVDLLGFISQNPKEKILQAALYDCERGGNQNSLMPRVEEMIIKLISKEGGQFESECEKVINRYVSSEDLLKGGEKAWNSAIVESLKEVEKAPDFKKVFDPLSKSVLQLIKANDKGVRSEVYTLIKMRLMGGSDQSIISEKTNVV